MDFEEDDSDPFDNSEEDSEDPFEISYDEMTETGDSRYCTVCGTMTSVTNGEVKYCGSCGRKLTNDWNRLGSGDGDANPDGDIGI